MGGENGEAPAAEPGPTDAERIARLEEGVALLAWLHAELIYAMQVAAAAQIAKQLEPALQQELLRRMGAAAAGQQ